MYKKSISRIILLFLLINFSLPFAYSQSARDDAIFIIEKVTQQTEVQIQREMGKVEEKINSNMDENIAQLDARTDNMLNTLTKKLLLGLVGGMTVVLVGYAWLVNYITRKYTPIYQRNLIRKKYKKAIESGKMEMNDYDMLDEEDRVVEQIGKEEKVQSGPFGVFNIFKKVKKEEELKKQKEYVPQFDYGVSEQFDYSIGKKASFSPTEPTPAGKKIWMFLAFFAVLIIVAGLAVYIMFDINLLDVVKGWLG